MYHKLTTVTSVFLLVALSIISWGYSAQAETTLIMGTGLPGGNYYKLGQLLADAVNKYTAQTGIRIKPRPTDGSFSNLKGLQDGEFQLGITQADAEYMAWNGKGHWAKNGKFKGLRTVYELYTEAVTCVATVESGIKTCADFRGKRVALGTEGSGTHINALEALSTCWLKPSDLGQALSVNPPQAVKLMTQGKLDAFFYTVGHPNNQLRKFIANYGRASMVPFMPTKAMSSQAPYYQKYFIWASDYPGLRNHGMKVDTFGIPSFLVTTDKVPAKIIYEIGRIFLSQLEYFKRNLPPMREVDPPERQSKRDLHWGVSAPFHEGIKKLSKERGIR
ncbi:MAG: TAXI family TRAP transporter solute-binding subunit [Desulfarculaceae bacterium]|nr:TAXI family TRAP transporter solute-binding subunit [Desulfarculaceae bacterium]MCF8047132.1 TAXI family TRAP transporter solute-binding subunit [Desulfarculaceae bacterium]MCF8063763.1 TAXI family TRAP transporter solute-binding subunit [Desulfarculaceae bacterium]MCF8098280.1 TAXI family TRAP transporter solute-binding subunit [Desulfarculaceae bacterium]MCF8120787.1 TAXI family TRAP transporter solute-binding subunit [Desulfarculaceae bacterium]